MRPGSPFKYRGPSVPYVGMLTTPDVLKYKIPIPFAFVPPNPSYDPRQTATATKNASPKNQLISASDFKINSECQKTIQNFNKCVKNNKDNSEFCQYYLNYLNLNCK